MISVIGIDPSLTRTGLASIAVDTNTADAPPTLTTATIHAPPSRLPVTDRITLIAATVAEWVAARPPTIVAVEEPIVWRSRTTTLRLAMLSGAIQAAVHRLGVPVVLANPKAVKRRIVGHGGASKPETVAAVDAITGRHGLSSDEADAVAVALYAIRDIPRRLT